MIKRFIYYHLTKHWFKHQFTLAVNIYAHILDTVFGLAVFNYGGIKLTASPVGYLDRFIILGKNINPFVTSALSQYLKNGGVFLDIGANHGVFSLLAAKNHKTKVFAFEPSQRELSRLWKNLELNPSNNISVFAYGLGEEEKNQELLINSRKNPGMNSLPNIHDRGHIINCNFSSLHKLLSANILKQTRVCKLDVEGQEMFILNSLRPHMDLFKECIFIVEISPELLAKVNFKAEDIYHFFKDAGYQAQFGNPNNLSQWDDVFYHPEFSSKMIDTQLSEYDF